MTRTLVLLVFTVSWIVLGSFCGNTKEQGTVCSDTNEQKEPTSNCTLCKTQEAVEKYASRVGLEQTRTLHLDATTDLELVLIPAGTFTMGTLQNETPVSVRRGMLQASSMLFSLLLAAIAIKNVRKHPFQKFSLAVIVLCTGTVSMAVYFCMPTLRVAADWATDSAACHRMEAPAHSVAITKPFYMSRFPVTQRQYIALMGENPSKFVSRTRPVDSVSWTDAQKFCQRLTGRCDLTIHLPSEAEWEYACRAGTHSAYFSGNSDADLDRVAWYAANSMETTHPVGQKEANDFGLFDMHGNVWQWCQDWFNESYYSVSPPADPKGPVNGTERVLRGGSWHFPADYCRSAFRIGLDPNERSSIAGFRVGASFQWTPE